MSCQYERFTTGSIIDEKQINHNRTNSNEDAAHNDQLVVKNASNANDISDDVPENGVLNFQNLELKCMCSDGETATVASASGVASLSSAPTTQGNHKQHTCDAGGSGSGGGGGDDDETDIEISDVEAVTEIEESMLKSHRCSHCGRDHCCFFLRCCYCRRKCITDDNSNANVDASNKASSCESDADAHSINTRLPTTTHSNQNQKNLASKRCDEICKIIHNESDGIGCNTMVSAAAAAVKQQCCDGNQTNDEHHTTTKSIAVCHCRWYCIQDCDLDSKANAMAVASAAADDHKKDETTLDVQKPEIVSPITNESPLNMDENRLRCCRCSKPVSELF